MDVTPELQRLINTAPQVHIVVFCCACCERLMPSYRRFEQALGRSDSGELRQVLDRLWGHAQGQVIAAQEALRLEQACEQAAPDTDDYSGVYVSPALDAATAVLETVRQCRTAGSAHASAVATAVTDAIDMFLQASGEVNASGGPIDQQLADHPLMLKEINKQNSDIRDLLGLGALGFGDIVRLRSASLYDALSV